MNSMNQRETASAVDNNRIATSRESIGMGEPQAISTNVVRANIRENSPRIILERSAFISRCELVGDISLAVGSLVLFLAVVFNQIERDLAILTSAALLILNAIDKPTTSCTPNGTDPSNDEMSIAPDDAIAGRNGQVNGRAS